MRKKRQPRTPKREIDRFMNNVVVGDNVTDCWPWRGQLTKYGKFAAANRTTRSAMLAHRFSYQYFYGDLKLTDSFKLPARSAIKRIGFKPQRKVTPTQEELTRYISQIREGGK